MQRASPNGTGRTITKKNRKARPKILDGLPNIGFKDRYACRGSGCSSADLTHCCSRYCLIAARNSGCFPDIIAAAKRAALIAPALPMASVPTGIPAGICTIDRSESIPCSDFDSIGTPSTGSNVFAAATPARCAAPPAPAIITSMPRDSADEIYSTSRSGVRCAERTRASYENF